MEFKNFIPINTWLFLRVPIYRWKYIGAECNPFQWIPSNTSDQKFTLFTLNIYLFMNILIYLKVLKKNIKFNENQY